MKYSALTIGATAASLCLVKLISFIYGVVIKLQVVFNSFNFFLNLYENLFMLGTGGAEAWVQIHIIFVILLQSEVL
jgi:hypothetical protein